MATMEEFELKRKNEAKRQVAIIIRVLREITDAALDELSDRDLAKASECLKTLHEYCEIALEPVRRKEAAKDLMEMVFGFKMRSAADSSEKGTKQ